MGIKAHLFLMLGKVFRHSFERFEMMSKQKMVNTRKKLSNTFCQRIQTALFDADLISPIAEHLRTTKRTTHTSTFISDHLSLHKIPSSRTLVIAPLIISFKCATSCIPALAHFSSM